jgi:hypothetical protein
MLPGRINITKMSPILQLIYLGCVIMQKINCLSKKKIPTCMDNFVIGILNVGGKMSVHASRKRGTGNNSFERPACS